MATRRADRILRNRFCLVAVLLVTLAIPAWYFTQVQSTAEEDFVDEEACPFQTADDSGSDHEHHHHEEEEADDSTLTPGQELKKKRYLMNRKNYKQFVGQYKNKKGDVVETPLVLSVLNGSLSLLTPLNFDPFVGGSWIPAGASSPAVGFPQFTDVVTVTFWFTKGCGGLCEDAYQEFAALAFAWNRSPLARYLAHLLDAPGRKIFWKNLQDRLNERRDISVMVGESSRPDGNEDNSLSQPLRRLVIQFGQYEVDPADDEDSTPRVNGPGGRSVFDFPTITVHHFVRCDGAGCDDNSSTAKGSRRRLAAGDAADTRVGLLGKPRGFSGALCAVGLLEGNVQRLLSSSIGENFPLTLRRRASSPSSNAAEMATTPVTIRHLVDSDDDCQSRRIPDVVTDAIWGGGTQESGDRSGAAHRQDPSLFEDGVLVV